MSNGDPASLPSNLLTRDSPNARLVTREMLWAEVERLTRERDEARTTVYQKRGGNPDSFPDSHPAYDITASQLRLGIWRRAAEAYIGGSSDETNCSDPGWEMRGGDLTCKGCGRKAREIFTDHDQEKASAAAVHLLSPKRCPDCGVQYVSGARHFSGCPSHPGESAQKAKAKS